MIRIFFFRTLTCNDGWQSPSIGSQGACSYHGGVEDGISIFSIVISLIISVFIHKRIRKKNEVEKIILERRSLHFISFLNSALCALWNLLMFFFKIIKLQKIFNGKPYILGGFLYLICLIFPILFLVILPLTITALCNNADEKNLFLIPK